MAFTKLTNSNERYLMYREAIQWYLTNTSFPIVVCENTNTDMTEGFVKDILSKRIEFITYPGNNHPTHLGKGYGEGQIVKKAFEKSILLSNAENVIKITGRYIITNIKTLVKCASSHKDLTTTLSFDGEHFGCASYFFVSKASFLRKKFIPHVKNINDTEMYFFEHLLFDCAFPSIKEYPFGIKRYGISGTSGKSFQYGLKEDFKQFARYLLHKMNIFVYHKVFFRRPSKNKNI